MIYQSDNPREDAKMSYKEQMKMTPKEKAMKYLQTKSVCSTKRISDRIVSFLDGVPKQCYFLKDINNTIDLALEEQAKEIYNFLKNNEDYDEGWYEIIKQKYGRKTIREVHKI